MAMLSFANGVRNSIRGIDQQRHQTDCSRKDPKDLLLSSILREMAGTWNTIPDDADVLGNINFSRVKEIKNNTFNKQDFFNLLKDGKQRLRSFHVGNWSHDVDSVDLAEAGFYYLQNQDRVQCVYCEIVLDGWTSDDDPYVEHARHSSRCPFVIGNDVGNIPIRSDPIRGPVRRFPSHDVCGNNSSNQHSSEDEIMSASSDEEEENIEVPALSSSPSSSQESTSWPMPSIRHGPYHKSYVSYNSRLKSFENPRWPRDCPIAPTDLAAAGFFYYGPFMGYLDSVKCFYCDTGLCQWVPDDDPWKEHKRVSPGCEFVELNYPPEMKLKKNMNAQDVVEEWLSSDLVQKFLTKNKCSKNVVRNVLSQKWFKSGYPFTTIEELSEAVTNWDPLSNLLRKDEKSYGEEDKTPTNSAYQMSWRTPSSQLSSSQGSQQSSISCYESGSSQCNSYLGSDSEEESTSRGRLICKVCWDGEVGCLIRPCNHIATCTNCGPALTNCPVCREKIFKVEKIFI